jgi:type II secretory pathway pseudopilin PulG
MDGAKPQPAVARCPWTRVHASELGQTLIEVVIAIGIFSVVSGSLITLLLSSLNTTNFSREKTLAQQAATTQVEKIRNMSYAAIGNPSGNPSGTVPLTTQLQIIGVWATMTARVEYVNDPTPLSYQSYANYKRVTITVTRNSDGRQLAQEVTNIAPPVKASQSEGTIIASVVDIGDNTVVSDVSTNITNGPSGSETDTTDSSGSVTFAGLTPTTSGQPYYTVGVTPPAGYDVLSDTTAPNGSVQFSLSPGQVATSTVKIYLPVTIYVQLYDNGGTPLSTAASVTVTSSRQTQAFSYAPSDNGQLMITELNGEDLVPGLSYAITVSGPGFASNNSSSTATVPASGYPTTLSSTFSFTANAISPPVNTVLPGITGTTQAGQTLTASTGTWTGNTPITYTYQWQDCTGSSCVNISGATAATYTLKGTDVGKTVQVLVTATNGDGNDTAASANTATVTGVPPANTAVPTISGTAKDGQTLTTTNGTWSGTTPITYTYQWQRCSGSCTNISGATSQSYTLTSTDVGKKIQVIVTGTNNSGNATATSAQTATVAAGPPSNSGNSADLPQISGSLTQGSTLTVTTGNWTGTAPITYTYQWYGCSFSSCSPISGATSASYTLTSSEHNKKMEVIVTASNSAGSATATSAQTARVN